MAGARRGTPLAAFESMIESLVERSLVAPLRGPIHPREIARRLARAMLDGVVLHVEGQLAPNDFRARLHSDDLEPLVGARQTIETELAAYLAGTGARRGLTFLSPPRVRLAADPGARRGTLAVEAQVSEPGPSLAARALGAARAGSRWSLELAGRRLPLPYGTLRLGRAPDCEVVLPSRGVSRYHAELIVDAHGARLRDLGSTNGTTVDGSPADDTQLTPGARLAFGDVTATIQRAPDGDGASP